MPKTEPPPFLPAGTTPPRGRPAGAAQSRAPGGLDAADALVQAPVEVALLEPGGEGVPHAQQPLLRQPILQRAGDQDIGDLVFPLGHEDVDPPIPPLPVAQHREIIDVPALQGRDRLDRDRDVVLLFDPLQLGLRPADGARVEHAGGVTDLRGRGLGGQRQGRQRHAEQPSSCHGSSTSIGADDGRTPGRRSSRRLRPPVIAREPSGGRSRCSTPATTPVCTWRAAGTPGGADVTTRRCR
jgi:hypothetical protein